MPLPASRSPSPGDGAAAPGSGANFTALLAARKFRANAMSEEKREERRTVEQVKNALENPFCLARVVKTDEY